MYADAAALLLVITAACGGCGGDTADLTPIRLVHSPPVGQLNAQQLRALSMECEKYVPEKSARGPYEAAYCEEAIAAWSDSPLQIVPIIKDESVRDSPASPQ